MKVFTAILLAQMRERAIIWEERMANKKTGDEMVSMVETLMSLCAGLAGTIERQTEVIDKLLRVIDEATEHDDEDEVKAGTES
jgi:CRISPR/Cas system CSM-associated protein Csm2 small subunit